ncbi:hypothetical protein DV113_004989 [Geotrichum candidum]|uniref:Similar to Saccharomyces cerevisiae YOR353C SOG2 Key component of the RAM signaling network, required for proper cell morphogenesis and cell separation after mitosis n=1 Tax=Geotrichum candidum TaxID=1173061 RepID=A0A0J9XBB4_GEOCN|nr:hypothetical protein DV452_004415 [Geotrichum candidum]KAF7496985.1 hypothetical protein DV113_004989 [Geotrichum candidum]KAI8131443.1 hypothetical protein DUD61_004889 [Geotrichum candidum]KAI9212353.1 hypothetical protein DS838_002785 [Geotrichum bryndzae]CDO54485.1 similar to Saccharomyces cerevisiae YOR353C SOG2 Key component of the RAM signaling network, required for proper cell morphogenesis and cell separation after mitosis [Geotrichum candidum]
MPSAVMAQHSASGEDSTAAHLLQLVLQQLEVLDSPPSAASDAASISSVDTESSSTSSAGVEILLNDQGITNSFPSSVAQAIRHVVGKLSLQRNSLRSLPTNFIGMEQLTYLDLSFNKFTHFPSVLTKLPSLVILDLSGNQIDRLPRNIENLDSLKILSLSSNRFKYLTPSILDMVELLVIQVDNNPWVLPPPELMLDSTSRSEDQSEWFDKVKAYVSNNADLIEEKLALEPLPDQNETDTDSTDTLPVDEVESSITPPPEMRDISSIINWIKLSQMYKNDPTESDTSTADPSEQHQPQSNEGMLTISSRAAKRMGFVIKKSQKDASGQSAPSIKTARDSLKLSPTALAFNPPEMPSLPVPSVRSHMRGLSHDSIMEPAKHIDRNPVDEHNNGVVQFDGGRITTTKISRERSHSASATTSPEKESMSGAYFRRLSTLNEEKKPTTSLSYLDVEKRVILAARNILFALTEFHSTVQRCSRLCNEKYVTVQLTERLYTGKSYNDQLVSVLEKQGTMMKPGEERSREESIKAVKAIVSTAVVSISNFKELAKFCREHIYGFTAAIDVKFIRSMILVTYGSINELYNSWNILNDTVETAVGYNEPVDSLGLRQLSNSSSRSAGDLPFPSFNTNGSGSITGSPLSSTFPLSTLQKDYSEMDRALYEGLEAAANAARALLAQLTDALSKSAITTNAQVPSASIAAHVKNLSTRCSVAVEVTRKLKDRLDHVRRLPSLKFSDRKLFWDDMNAFLKGIIAILSTTKSAMNDLPYLKGTQSFITLTKLTKELPPLIDSSSYKAMMGDPTTAGQQQHQLHPPPIPIDTNGANLALPAPPTTPLAAALGPAAMAVLPSPPANKTFVHSPFIPSADSSVTLTSASPLSPSSAGAAGTANGSKLSPSLGGDYNAFT